MIKSALSIIFFVSVAMNTNAQTFVYSTPMHIDDVIYDDGYYIYGINFKTNRPQEIVYKWEKIENSLSPFWNYSLCDYTGCYIGVPDNGTMTLITQEESEAGKEGFFSLSINTGEIIGEGKLLLYVYDSNNPSSGDTVSFHITRAVPTGIEQEITAEVEPIIFPNPVSDVLHVSLSNLNPMNHVTVYNAIGELMYVHMDLKSNKLILDVSTYEAGIYFVNITSFHGELFSKKLIIR